VLICSTDLVLLSSSSHFSHKISTLVLLPLKMVVIMVPMVPENAYYDMAVNYIAFAPWIIWGALWVAYVVTSEGAFWITSWGVTLSSVPLYLLLVYFDDVRPGLMFPVMERWSFPNLEIAAVSSFFIFVLFFRVYYKMRVSYFQWFFLGVFFLIPPVVHLVAAGTEFWKVGSVSCQVCVSL